MKSRNQSQFSFSNNLFCALFLLFLTNHVQASPLLDLGIAGTFNGFVLGDMNTSNSDVEGRLAVGGKLSLNNYSIGKVLTNSNGTRDDLIAGGTLNFTNGRVYNGNARSGGVANINQTVGFYDTDPNVSNGSYTPGNPLDFVSIGNELKQKSTSWSSLSATGTTLTDYNNIRLTGANSGLNVFSLSGANLSSASSFWLDIPEDSWALINISGTTINMHDFGFFRTINNNQQQLPDNQPGVFRQDGSLLQNVLFNMSEAKTLNLYAIGIKGSLLAPNADTTFYNGHIDGDLIVGSLKGLSGQNGGQINYYPFLPTPVPLPSMFIPVLMLLAGFVKQQMTGRKKRFF